MFRLHSRSGSRRRLLLGVGTAAVLVAVAAPAAQAAPFVYVANPSGIVSQYDVGAGGLLAPLSPPTVAAAAYPWALAVSPNGESVYVASSLYISQYDVGPGGTLSPKSPATVDTTGSVGPDLDRLVTAWFTGSSQRRPDR